MYLTSIDTPHAIIFYTPNASFLKIIFDMLAGDLTNTVYGINWFPTPPQRPDLNPIDNLWHELKLYIAKNAKPRTKDELVAGIRAFWHTVDAAKCTKYINHLKKVIPIVIGISFFLIPSPHHT